MPARASLAPGLSPRRPARAEAGRPGTDPAASLLVHLAPLLDLAFGTEGEAAFPEEIAALVASLRAGPPGPAAHEPERAITAPAHEASVREPV